MHGNNVINQNSNRKYFLPRLGIKNCNIEIDGRNFYDQTINDSIKQNDEIRKMSTGQGDAYTTSYLLDFAYFEKKKTNLGKQKVLDADTKAIQQIIFTGKANNQIRFITFLNNQKKES